MNDRGHEAGRLHVGTALTGHEPSEAEGYELTWQDGRIAEVRAVRGGEAPSKLRIATPCLVNAHDHGWAIRTNAFGTHDAALEFWIPGLSHMPSVDPYLAATVAFGRMARCGIGATVHCHNSLRAERLIDDAAAVKRAATEVGIRLAFCCPIFDRNPITYGGPDLLDPHLTAADAAALRARLPVLVPGRDQLAAIDAVEAQLADPLFSVQIGPIGPQWCRDETLVAIAEASAHSGRRIHMHLLESERQRRWLDSVYPQGIVRFLDEIGFLSPRLTVAHGVWLTEPECALLAERGVTVAINTVSNLRLGSGIAPSAAFRRHDLAYAFGLDALSLDDDDDAVRDFRLAYLLHRGFGTQATLDPATFLRHQAAQGSRVIDGSARSGVLEPGAPADILVFDLAEQAADLLVEDPDPLALLLNRATCRQVRETVVAGRRIVQDGQLTRVNLAAAEDELTAAAASQPSLDPAARALTSRIVAALEACYRDGAHLGRKGEDFRD